MVTEIVKKVDTISLAMTEHLNVSYYYGDINWKIVEVWANITHYRTATGRVQTMRETSEMWHDICTLENNFTD